MVRRSEPTGRVLRHPDERQRRLPGDRRSRTAAPQGSAARLGDLLLPAGTGRTGMLFRRIEFYDEEQDRVLVFVTNHLTLAAATVAEVYKQRWQIELFFKALKQNLRVKTFIGTSANALKTQVWAALIAILLIKYLQLKATFGWSLSNLVALL